MRILLAEDHPIVRQGTRLFLESMGIQVVGEATTGREAIQLSRELLPDLVIMDIHMPDLTGIEATRRIRNENEAIRILALTAYDNPSYVLALLEAGADGFVLKNAELSSLIKAIQEVSVGHPSFDAELLAQAYQLPVTTYQTELSDREVEVLRHAAQGLTNKQIAEMLFISDRTVQGHLQKIYHKLGVTTRTEAVTTALAQKLFSLEDRL
jgi:two-component system, NarL family, response regulator LiaR